MAYTMNSIPKFTLLETYLRSQISDTKPSSTGRYHPIYAIFAIDPVFDNVLNLIDVIRHDSVKLVLKPILACKLISIARFENIDDSRAGQVCRRVFRGRITD